MNSAQMFSATPSVQLENRGQAFVLPRCAYNLHDSLLASNGYCWTTSQFLDVFEGYLGSDVRVESGRARWTCHTDVTLYRQLLNRGLANHVVCQPTKKTFCQLVCLLLSQGNGCPGVLEHTGRSTVVFFAVDEKVLELRIRRSIVCYKWYLHATPLGEYPASTDCKFIYPTPILSAV